ncbi:MAG TPA: hypothetical protein VL403_00990, partial [Candidatus Kryptonia bacterium]|nr:hypothetical protein [Candidatus Kryptonia bacterium]
MLAASARADVVTEKTASIIDFPKVIFNSGEDTIIQITSSSPNMLHAHCFYVDARLPDNCPQENALVGCVPIWQETDFTIWLTRQQPTHWKASTGRPVDPTDDFSFGDNGAGIDPGAVPPLTTGFQGELLCVETDPFGNPIDGNHLYGEATLLTTANNDVSKYNAVGIQSTVAANATCPDDQGRCILLLNNPRGESSGEYNACPETLVLSHLAEGATDPVLQEFNRQNSTIGISNELTLVPCSKDFENQQAGTVTVQFAIYNEFEERFSASTTITCWRNIELTDIDSPTAPERSVFHFNNLGTLGVETRITPASDTDGAVIGVLEV